MVFYIAILCFDVPANSDLGIFTNFNGEPQPRNPVDWGQSPIKMVRCGHYVVAILNDGAAGTTGSAAASVQGSGGSNGALAGYNVRIASLLDQRIVQSLKCWKCIGIAADFNKVVIASSSEIAVLTLTSLQQQINAYMELGISASISYVHL